MDKLEAARAAAARRQHPPTGMPPATEPAGEVFSLSDFESRARARLSHMVYEFIASGAGDELTLRWNREAWDRLRLRPRVLTDVSVVDTRVTLLGQALPFPILLAPTAYHRLVHPEGEPATARGAGAAAATLVVSTSTTTAIEEIARAATQPLWFQLYFQPDRGFTRELVQRVEAAGCRALCVTVDTPVLGARNRQQRARFALPPGMETPHVYNPNTRRRPLHLWEPRVAVTWKDVDWLRSFARVPVLLKGILDPEDADLAVQAGVSGIIVSNHGARNLDTALATAEALPQVADRVAGRVPLLVDGGIRRGTDVLKALAFGATAVLIGRPYLYALGAAGEAGVRHAIDILRTELGMAMALTGCASLPEITRRTLAKATVTG
jgi:4-hydroxymandelate oxidase